MLKSEVKAAAPRRFRYLFYFAIIGQHSRDKKRNEVASHFPIFNVLFSKRSGTARFGAINRSATFGLRCNNLEATRVTTGCPDKFRIAKKIYPNYKRRKIRQRLFTF